MRRTWILAIVFAIASAIVGRLLLLEWDDSALIDLWITGSLGGIFGAIIGGVADILAAVEEIPGRLPTHPLPVPRDDPAPKPSDTRIQR
jgi:hypothetical protein